MPLRSVSLRAVSGEDESEAYSTGTRPRHLGASIENCFVDSEGQKDACTSGATALFASPGERHWALRITPGTRLKNAATSMGLVYPHEHQIGALLFQHAERLPKTRYPQSDQSFHSSQLGSCGRRDALQREALHGPGSCP